MVRGHGESNGKARLELLEVLDNGSWSREILDNVRIGGKAGAVRGHGQCIGWVSLEQSKVMGNVMDREVGTVGGHEHCKG